MHIPPADRVRALLAVGAEHPDAPSPALLLHGKPLIVWAVQAVVASAVPSGIERVVVAGPSAVAEAVRDHFPCVQVVPVVGGFREALRAGHDCLAPRDDDLVLIHDPRYPLAAEHLVRAVLAALRTAGPDVAAAIPTRPVTDTLKWVDGAGDLVGTAPRDAFRTVVAPQAYRNGALARALADRQPLGSDDSVSRLPEQIRRLGGGLMSVEAPPEVFEVTGPDDVLLAEAMLADASTDRPPPQGSCA